MNIWQELGIAPSRDVREIKLAYATRLKQVHPEDDAEGFQRLRAAYERARALAESAPAVPVVVRVQPAPPELPSETSPTLEPQASPIASPPPLAEGSDEPVESPIARRPVRPEPPASSASHPTPESSPLAKRPVHADPLPSGLPLPNPRVNQPSTAAIPPPLQRLISAPPLALAAEQLCTLLLDVPANQRPAALKSALRQPGWENLDFQLALQSFVLNRLHQHFDALFPLIDSFAEYYEWKSNRLQTAAQHAAVEALMQRVAARQARRHYENAHESRRRRTAFELLANPVNEAAFQRFRRWNANLRAMRELLAELHAHQQVVLHYELDAASVRWWIHCLNADELTIERIVGTLLRGLVGGPLAIGMLAGILGETYGYDLDQHPVVAIPLLILSVLVPLGWIVLRRRLRQPDAVAVIGRFQRWRAERLADAKKLNHTRVLAGLLVLLTAWTGTVPGFEIFPVLAALMLWFMTSFRSAAAALILIAWPLQVPFSIQLAQWLERSPDVAAWFKSPPIILFPHMAASFLVEPMIQRFLPHYQKFRPNKPVVAWQFGFSLAVFIAFVAGFVPLVLNAPSTGYSPNDPPVQSTKHR